MSYQIMLTHHVFMKKYQFQHSLLLYLNIEILQIIIFSIGEQSMSIQIVFCSYVSDLYSLPGLLGITRPFKSKYDQKYAFNAFQDNGILIINPNFQMNSLVSSQNLQIPPPETIQREAGSPQTSKMTKEGLLSEAKFIAHVYELQSHDVMACGDIISKSEVNILEHVSSEVKYMTLEKQVPNSGAIPMDGESSEIEFITVEAQSSEVMAQNDDDNKSFEILEEEPSEAEFITIEEDQLPESESQVSEDETSKIEVLDVEVEIFNSDIQAVEEEYLKTQVMIYEDEQSEIGEKKVGGFYRIDQRFNLEGVKDFLFNAYSRLKALQVSLLEVLRETYKEETSSDSSIQWSTLRRLANFCQFRVTNN